MFGLLEEVNMTDKKPLFSEHDRKIIESAPIEPKSGPGYELLKGILIWQDETPMGIPFDTIELLIDLQIARAIKYHGRDLPEFLNPSRYLKLWEQALEEGLKWHGFLPERLNLSDEDKAYFEKAQKDASNAEDW